MSSSVILGTADGKEVVAAIDPATFSAPLERVRLTADYHRAPPPGFPALEIGHRLGAIIDAGVTLRVTGAEADALIAAGAAIAIDRAPSAQVAPAPAAAEPQAPDASAPQVSTAEKLEGRPGSAKKSAQRAAPPTLKVPS
jgi:hypothetical protein